MRLFMAATELFPLIEEAFPYVPRPALEDISFHHDGCAHCEMSLKELAQHPNPELPREVIRYLFDELTTLSPSATRWALPSYLRHVLSEAPEMETATEFFIYSLAPSPEYEAETTQRLSLLDTRQIQCLLAIVSYWQQHEYWGTYCPEDLDRAKHFLERLNA